MPTSTSLMLGWWMMLGGTVALFALVAAAAWWARRREVPGPARRRALRADWAAHAAAVDARSRQAARRLAAARERLAAAERECSGAWRALAAAQQTQHDAAGAHREAVRRRRGDPPDPQQRREVARAALAAYRRGDLSREQLWRVWSWGTGWDPELARCERELLRARAARREAQLRYRVTAGRERAALAEWEVAEVAVRALAEEAATAAAGAGWDYVLDEFDDSRAGAVGQAAVLDGAARGPG